MRAIHCPYCQTDNEVALDVVGKFCENCGKPIYSTEVEDDSEAPKAIADRTGELLRVTCPHCQFRNEFPPGVSRVFIFACHDCGEPVAVEELRQ